MNGIAHESVSAAMSQCPGASVNVSIDANGGDSANAGESKSGILGGRLAVTVSVRISLNAGIRLKAIVNVSLNADESADKRAIVSVIMSGIDGVSDSMNVNVSEGIV